MTLEDQIRRMGQARAAEVSTTPWRDRVGGSRRGRRRLVAVATVIAVVGAIGFVLSRDDAADTDTADPHGPDAERTIVRWVPATGVEQIEYPGVLGALMGFWGFPDVALVTPTATDDPATTQWSRIEGGSSPYRRLANDADDFRVRVVDDIATLSLTRDDLTVARVASRRFTVDQLTDRAPDLFSISRDVHLLAAAIAAWDDSTVRYVGDPVRADATITGPNDDDDLVARLHTHSSEQFVATFGGAESSDRYLTDLFALESAEGAELNEEYFTFPSEESPVAVTESEWLAIVDDVLGADPPVEFPGSELYAMEPGAPDLARPAASAFEREDGHWSVRLHYPESTSFRDGGVLDVRMGGVLLTFGPAEPGVAFDSLAVESRLTDTEARRYAELINAFLDDPADPPPTLDPYPTVAPPPGACAANPPPADDVLDLATHIAFDRTPLDLDQDGIGDELMIYDNADGNWFLLARLQTGWTNAVDLGRPARVVLMNTPDGVPAATDLDADGGLEFFLGDYGNTARASAMASLAGCELRIIYGGTPDDRHEGWILHGVGGNSCAPSGCHPRVRCVDNSLVLEVVEPNDEWRGIGDADPASVVVAWSTTTFELVGGIAVAADATTAEYPLLGLPVDAPGPDDSDLIDCSP